MQLFLSLVMVAFVAKVNAQLPVVQFDMNEFMAHQQQHQAQHQQFVHEQPRQMDGEEPVVGTPLMGLKLGMPFGIHHALGNLGIPGMRFSNFHAGNIGGLKFGNTLLGAGNPMADEGEDQILEKKKWKWYKHKHIEPMIGDAQQYQADPQLAGAPQQQGFLHHHWFLNEDSNLGAAPQPQHAEQQYQIGAPQMQHFDNQQYQIGAPQMQQFDHQQYQIGAPEMQHLDHQHYQVAAPQMQNLDHQHYQVAAPQMPLFDLQPIQPMGPPVPQNQGILPISDARPEDGARHWFKGHDDYSGYKYENYLFGKNHF